MPGTAGPVIEPDTAEARQIASLFRILVFVRDNLDGLDADFPSYCTSLALESLVMELTARGHDPAEYGIRSPAPDPSLNPH